MGVSWLCRVSDSTFDPHGSLAKEDIEEVATYIQKQKQRCLSKLEGETFQKSKRT